MSLPFGSASFTPANLQWLTMEQVLQAMRYSGYSGYSAGLCRNGLRVAGARRLRASHLHAEARGAGLSGRYRDRTISVHCVATGCTVAQQAALCCNRLHCVATGCTILQLPATCRNSIRLHLCCNRLHRVATNGTQVWASPDSAVVAFGGSYGGMLAAWLRMKYPAAVDGAIAGRIRARAVWGPAGVL